MTDLLSELEALTDKFRHDPYVSGAEQVEIAHRIDAIKAEIAAAVRDSQRIDWLADPENKIGNVQLPSECVMANLHSLRAAIDTAMRAGEGEG